MVSFYILFIGGQSENEGEKGKDSNKQCTSYSIPPICVQPTKLIDDLNSSPIKLKIVSVMKIKMTGNGYTQTDSCDEYPPLELARKEENLVNNDGGLKDESKEYYYHKVKTDKKK